MLEHLFGSKTRFKLLKLFFRDSAKFYYVRELTRLIDSQINAVRRELALLARIGLIKEIAGKKNGGHSRSRKYYILDTESVLYPEMRALLAKTQTLGEQEFLENLKKKAGNLVLLLLTGYFTGDKRAPSDMLLVGNIKEKALDRLVKKYEKDLGTEIRYTIMSEDEFNDRRNVMDKFLFSLFEADNLKVVNKINA